MDEPDSLLSPFCLNEFIHFGGTVAMESPDVPLVFRGAGQGGCLRAFAARAGTDKLFVGLGSKTTLSMDSFLLDTITLVW